MKHENCKRDEEEVGSIANTQMDDVENKLTNMGTKIHKDSCSINIFTIIFTMKVIFMKELCA